DRSERVLRNRAPVRPLGRENCRKVGGSPGRGKLRLGVHLFWNNPSSREASAPRQRKVPSVWRSRLVSPWGELGWLLVPCKVVAFLTRLLAMVAKVHDKGGPR